jgi:hypothetical protein
MSDKFSLYDLLATVVPGTLIVCLMPVFVPDLAAAAKALNLPDAFALIGLIALALFAGNVVQAVASQLDPVLFWLWGGRPSERCLRHGLGERYMPLDSAERIRGKLVAAVGAAASDRSLFLFAMQQAESAGTQRVTTFNALFAYHRALLILTAIGVTIAIAIVCGQGPESWSAALRWGLLVGSVLLFVLLFFRTRQRAFYYVREVLLTAERVMDQRAIPSATSAAASAPVASATTKGAPVPH